VAVLVASDVLKALDEGRVTASTRTSVSSGSAESRSVRCFSISSKRRLKFSGPSSSATFCSPMKKEESRLDQARIRSRLEVGALRPRPGHARAQPVVCDSPGASTTTCEDVFASTSLLKASASVSIGGKVS
jgi:hypothetical protein